MASRSIFALAAILLFGLSLTACQPQRAARQPCPAGELCLEYGNTTESNSLDPQVATTTSEAAILREVFEGMYTDGPDGGPVFGVATSAQTSSDGLVWTFHMRPEVWSDGAPVTANDFVYAYRRDDSSPSGVRNTVALETKRYERLAATMRGQVFSGSLSPLSPTER